MARTNRKSLRSSGKSRVSRAVAGARPRFTAAEPLEGRLLFSTYTVTSNADSGVGTLRDAIVQANANPGADTIQFNLASSATTISLTSSLPAITDAVTIDGTSQPGYAGKPVVMLDGAAAGSVSGLSVHSSNVTIEGLVISRFGSAGIDFSNGSASGTISNITISGNFIGTDASGEVAMGNTSEGINLLVNSVVTLSNVAVSNNLIAANGGGIYLYNVQNSVISGNFIGTDFSGTLSSDAFGAHFGNQGDGVNFSGSSMNDTLGGTTVAARNVISNNAGNGVVMGTNSDVPNLIEGNYLGVDVSGSLAMGNAGDGIYQFTGGDTISGNVISANGSNGIDISDNTTLLSNFIGTDASGVNALGNAFDGVTVFGSNNVIGMVGQGNVIAYNGAFGPGMGMGVDLFFFAATNDSIRGNAIFGNSALGIDLGADGVTPNSNDPNQHFGANNLQNYPVLSTASVSGGSVTITGTFSASPSTDYDLDFFATEVADPSGHGQARTFLGTIHITTLADGTFSFSHLFSGVPAGEFVFTATATDPTGNTSEFSADVVAPSTSPATTTNMNVNGSQFGFGQSVVVSVAVTANSGSGVPTGTVKLMDGSNVLAYLTLDTNGTAQFSDTSFAIGSHSLSAVYLGDANYTSSTASATVQVSPEATSTSLSATTPVHLGQSMTLTAVVSPGIAESVMPSGTVSFFDGTTLLGSQSLGGSNSAMLTVMLPPGTHSFTASYSGDTDFAASGSSQVSGTVTREGTMTMLSGGAGTSRFGQPVTFSAAVNFADPESVNPGGSVSFVDGSVVIGTAILDATGHASFTAVPSVGTHSIFAVYSGDGSFAGSASAAVSQTVTTETTSLVLSSSGTSNFGQSVVFSAALSFPDAESVRPTGAITFMDGTTVLAAVAIDPVGRASFTTSALSVGGHTITAVYSGDTDYAASSSVGLSQMVNKAPTSLGLSSSATSATAGQAVTFTATVAPSSVSGTVTFFDGGVAMGTVALASGQASFTTSSLSIGTHVITSSYSGDATNALSMSSAVSETISRPAPSATRTSIAGSSGKVGSVMTFVAGVTTPSGHVPSGNVTFSDGNNVLGTVALVNGSASFNTSSLALGPHTITASYGGDADDLTSTSSSLSIMVSAPATGPVASGQSSKNNFWSHTDGVNLLLGFNGSFTSTALGDWLAATFPNLFGPASQYFNMKGASNLQVSVDYQFAVSSAPAAYADMFTIALNMYASSSTLGGSAASTAAGFSVSAAGLAGGTVKVGPGPGAQAFGVAGNSTQTVFDLLMDANNNSPSGNLFMGNKPQITAADGVLNDILKAGK